MVCCVCGCRVGWRMGFRWWGDMFVRGGGVRWLDGVRMWVGENGFFGG